MDWFLYDNGLRHERVKAIASEWPRQIISYDNSNVHFSGIFDILALKLSFTFL